MNKDLKKNSMKIYFFGIVSFFLFVVFSYIAAAVYISNQRQNAFDAVKIGDDRERVLALFGSSFVSEQGNNAFVRYTSAKCVEPCRERLWFENRMTLDTEAWSVEFGDGHRVIEKTQWNSP